VSAYHVRCVEAFRLKQLKSRDDAEEEKIDVCMSHDWPSGIADFGNVEELLRIKPYFREDIERNQLGNPATMDLIYDLKPSRWFSAHMHVRFTAEVPHASSTNEDGSTRTTQFLALDKPIPRQAHRIFLEHIEIPQEFDQQEEKAYEKELSYDKVWLAILKSTDFLTELTDKRVYMPGKVAGSDDRYDFRPTQEELDEVMELMHGDLKIPMNFRRTAPIEQEPFNRARFRCPPSLYYRNPQSTEFCEKLGIRDLNQIYCLSTPNQFIGVPYYCHFPPVEHPPVQDKQSAEEAGKSSEKNPDEIDVGEEEDEFGGADFLIDVRPTGGQDPGKEE